MMSIAFWIGRTLFITYSFSFPLGYVLTEFHCITEIPSALLWSWGKCKRKSRQYSHKWRLILIAGVHFGQAFIDVFTFSPIYSWPNQLTMASALYVETSWSPYQLFHRTFAINLTTSIVSWQSCVAYTTFVGNTGCVLSFTTSELNGVYSLKWRLTDRYLRWGTRADPRPGRADTNQCKSSDFLQELRIWGFLRFWVSPTCFRAK